MGGLGTSPRGLDPPRLGLDGLSPLWFALLPFAVTVCYGKESPLLDMKVSQFRSGQFASKAGDADSGLDFQRDKQRLNKI